MDDTDRSVSFLQSYGDAGRVPLDPDPTLIELYHLFHLSLPWLGKATS
jgi:hypothetical protein